MTSNGPNGDLMLRTLAVPADTNPSGDIFGGWLLSQMDVGGSLLVTEGIFTYVAMDRQGRPRPVHPDQAESAR